MVALSGMLVNKLLMSKDVKMAANETLPAPVDGETEVPKEIYIHAFRG